MRILLWMGASFLALCLATGLYFYASAPPGAKPLAPDAIIAVGLGSIGANKNSIESFIALRKNRRYEQWIVDPKSGRVFLYTQKWESGTESSLARQLGGENSILLHKVLDGNKVVKTRTFKNAQEAEFTVEPAELFDNPTPEQLNRIAALRKKWEAQKQADAKSRSH